MAKYLIASALLLAIAMPAGADIYEQNGATPDVEIFLTIPCYTNVWWNDPGRDDTGWDGNDHTITFNTIQNGQTGGDWWSDTLEGNAYGVDPDDPKASTDAYAEGYFESFDAAFLWLQSNCAVDLTITGGGNLASAGNELDTWFTMALTNNENGTGGFINGGASQSCCDIPLDGPGCFAWDSGGGTLDLFNPAHCHPNQDAIPMTGTYTASFSAFAEGTILFHARVLRNGISDPAGVYDTDMDLAWANP